MINYHTRSYVIPQYVARYYYVAFISPKETPLHSVVRMFNATDVRSTLARTVVPVQKIQ